MSSVMPAGIRQHFCNIQLIPAANGFDQQSAQKDTCHFPNIHSATGIAYNDMLVRGGRSRIPLHLHVASQKYLDSVQVQKIEAVTGIHVLVQFFDDEAKNVHRVSSAAV